jgi:hypothetical protein
MANARILYANAADLATLVASSEASASYAVANLQSDIKSSVWRSTGTTEYFTATWTADQPIGGVVLPFTYLSATATMRVRLYDASSTLLLDTGTNLAVPGGPPDLWGWTAAQLNSNSFGYGGGAYARAWFTQTSARSLRVDIVDTSNPQGYLEVGRLVAGPYWQMSKNPDYGLQWTPAVDTSKHYRTDGGNLATDVGTKHRKQVVPLTMLTVAERNTFWSIIYTNSLARPILFSLFPDESGDPIGEQMGMVYGKFMQSPATNLPSFRNYVSSMEIEEI